MKFFTYFPVILPVQTTLLVLFIRDNVKAVKLRFLM